MKHAGIAFGEILIPLYQGDSKENILKHSPSGKVPFLKHGKVEVWESLAVCEYIADIFPEKNLWPKEAGARAKARAISNEMHAGFQALRTNCPMDIKAKRKPKDNPPQLAIDIGRVQAIWEECRRENKKTGPFLFGPFTVADAMYAPVVFRFNTYDIPVKGEAKAYFETMLNLPAMKEWAEAGKKESWVINQF